CVTLAFGLQSQGKHAEAEPLLRTALAIRQRALGENHPEAAHALEQVASSLHAQGKYGEAEELLRKALALSGPVLGEEHQQTGGSRNRLGAVLSGRGKYAEAAAQGTDAARGFEVARLTVAATGLDRTEFSTKNTPLPSLAACLARLGKPADAWRCRE